MSRPVQLNMKPLEWGKRDKNGRIVCDLGTPASLLGGDIIAVIKDVLGQRPIIVHGQEMHYVKSPDRNLLRQLFARMRGENMFLYFSDDSTWSRRCSDGMLFVDLDLASCDLSNGPAVFQYLVHLFPARYAELGKRLIEQCCSTAKLGYGRGSYKFKPVWYYEYSGTTLTTLLNNVANIMIGEQLAMIPYGTRAQTVAHLERVLTDCGWRVPFKSGDECRCFEDITFLKNSPVYTVNGDVDSILNFGVILRTLGQRTWDLPGKGTMEKRGYEFNSSLVRGFKHAGDTALLRLLKKKFRGNAHSAENESYLVKYLTGSDIGLIDDASIAARYKISSSDLQVMYNAIESAGFGDIIDTVASRAILAKDYGL